MKIVLVGYGIMGSIHARVLMKVGILHSIIEPDKRNAEKAAQQTGVPVLSDLSNLTEKVDGFIIAAPTRFHSIIANKVLELFPDFKGLLIEKPLSSELAEARELYKRLSSYKERIIIGHSEMYNPVVSKFISLVNTGDFGKLRTFSITRCGSVGKSRIPSLGGILEDLGVYDFDILSRFITGKITVYATGVGEENVLSSVIVNLKGNGFQGVVRLSREFSGKERSIVFECEKATIMVDLISQTIEIRGLEETEGSSTMVKIPHGPGSSIKLYGEPLFEEILNLKGIIEGKEKPLVDLDRGIKALVIVDACKKSVDLGAPVLAEI